MELFRFFAGRLTRCRPLFPRCQTLGRHNSVSRSSGVMHSTMIRGKWSHFPDTQLSRRFDLIPIQTRFNINVSLPRNNNSSLYLPSSACIYSRNLIGPSAEKKTRTGIWCRWVNRVSASLCIIWPTEPVEWYSWFNEDYRCVHLSCRSLDEW